MKVRKQLFRKFRDGSVLSGLVTGVDRNYRHCLYRPFFTLLGHTNVTRERIRIKTTKVLPEIFIGIFKTFLMGNFQKDCIAIPM